MPPSDPTLPLSTFRRHLRAARLIVALAGLVAGTCGCHDADPLLDPALLRVGLLSLQSESEHFVFFAVPEEHETLAVIAEALEGQRGAILDHLEADVPFRVRVEVYPDLDSFHRAAGLPNPQDWFIGQIASMNTIRIVSPRNPGPAHDYASVLRGVVHEFVHVATVQVNPSVASWAWLSEGVATFEAGQAPSWQEMRDAAASGALPTLADLTPFESFVAHEGYDFSYTIAEYVIARHGRGALAQLVRQPRDFEAACGPGMTEAGFERAWHAFLGETYR